MIEIERKFLVKFDAYRKEATSKERIVQGFLNTHPERTVRVRVKGDSGYLTIKGKSNVAGTTRFEWEQEIPLSDAEKLLELCDKGTIDKIRYNVHSGNHVYEIDEFHGENEGLVLAEIELQSEDEVFEKKEWLCKEVTGEIRYYNSQLSKMPYTTWKK